MKKTLLSFMIVFLLVSAVQAQSLVIKDKSGTDITGQSIDVYCAPSTGYAMATVGLDVFNISDVLKKVKVRRYDVALVDSSEVSFCWTSCYPSSVTESPQALDLEAGTSTTLFTGDFTYYSPRGTSTAKFVFFDMENPVDSSFVTINFVIGTLGLPENKIPVAVLSNAYPNPATNVLNFDYKLGQATQNARIRINNLLGSTMQEIALDKSEGKTRIDISNLNNGVYFYSLMINNSVTTTRKFIVKR